MKKRQRIDLSRWEHSGIPDLLLLLLLLLLTAAVIILITAFTVRLNMLKFLPEYRGSWHKLPDVSPPNAKDIFSGMAF